MMSKAKATNGQPLAPPLHVDTEKIAPSTQQDLSLWCMRQAKTNKKKTSLLIQNIILTHFNILHQNIKVYLHALLKSSSEILEKHLENYKVFSIRIPKWWGNIPACSILGFYISGHNRNIMAFTRF